MKSINHWLKDLKKNNDYQVRIVVENVFRKYKLDTCFSVQEVLQVTLPAKLAQEMFGNSKSFTNTKQLTGHQSLSDPTIAFNITPDIWTLKRRAAISYVSQKNSLSTFHLWPKDADTVLNYSSFDREYFYEI